jgi:hypothetical protein
VDSGIPAFKLVVTGKNFTTSTTVELLFNGAVQSGATTTFIGSTELDVAVPASAVAIIGNLSVELLNNGMAVSSAPADLPVDQGNPVITSISPSSVTAGGPGFTLTVNGLNLIGNIEWGSNSENSAQFNGATSTSNPTQFTVAVPATAIAYPGTVSIAVGTPPFNDQPGVTSNVVTLVINPAPAGVFQSISIASGGAAPNGASSEPMVSASGRFVSFASQATNLVASGTLFPQDYVQDLCIGALLLANNGNSVPCTPSTLLISAEPAGDPANPMEPNGGSSDPSMGDQEYQTFIFGGIGQYFEFLSTATNLIVPSTTYQQAYFRNTCYNAAAISGCNPMTVLISANQNGAEPNGPATDVAMATNWCNGVFVSSATNVIAGVTTPNEIYFSQCDATDSSNPTFTTTFVVSSSTAGVPANQGGSQPAIDGLGDVVAFASTSTNLSSTSNAGYQQIYLWIHCQPGYIYCANSTSLISTDNSGNALAGNSQNPSLTDDGRFAMFTTLAPQSGGGTSGTVYRYDNCLSYEEQLQNCTPSNSAFPVGASGATPNGSSNSGRHAMSIDGRFVAFDSTATNVLPGGNPAGQVFVRDTCLTSTVDVSPPPPNCVPTTNLVSVNKGTAIGGSQEAISVDGHFVTFVTTIGGVQQVVLAYTGF